MYTTVSFVLVPASVPAGLPADAWAIRGGELVSRGQTAFFLLYSDGKKSRRNIKLKKRSGHARLEESVKFQLAPSLSK